MNTILTRLYFTLIGIFLAAPIVVVAGVWDLWMAELQAIKGGVGCADGH